MAGDGVANSHIATIFGISRPTVLNWRARFRSDGLDSVGKVRPGRGRKPGIAAHQVQAIVHATLHEKAPGATQWSCRSMAKADAEQFLDDLRERMSQFVLELHPDKTRLVEFGRFAMADRRARGERRPETFDFLGFTHYCKKKRNGNFGLGRKPIAKRVTRTLQRVKEKLRERMHEDVHDTAQWLGRVVNGWLNYYAVPTSARALRGFARRLLWIWLRTLRGRSQKDRTTDSRGRTPRGPVLASRQGPAPLANRAICRQPPKVGAVCASAHVRI